MTIRTQCKRDSYKTET